jgi:hypothetical protein
MAIYPVKLSHCDNNHYHKKTTKFAKSSIPKYAVGAGLCQKSMPPTDRRSVKTRPHQHDRLEIDPFPQPDGNLPSQIIPSQ